MRDAPGTARRERTSNPYPRAPSVRHRSSPARPNPDGRADPHPTVARPSRDRDCAGDARGVRVASADGLRRPVPAGHAKHFVFRLCVAERGSTPVGNVSNPFRIRTLVRIGAAFRRVGRKTEARDSFGTKLRLTPVCTVAASRSPRKRWAKTENDINRSGCPNRTRRELVAVL